VYSFKNAHDWWCLPLRTLSAPSLLRGGINRPSSTSEPPPPARSKRPFAHRVRRSRIHRTAPDSHMFLQTSASTRITATSAVRFVRRHDHPHVGTVPMSRPHIGGVPQYRVTSTTDGHQRTMPESQIRLAPKNECQQSCFGERPAKPSANIGQRRRASLGSVG
jgi:hypothetical protein